MGYRYAKGKNHETHQKAQRIFRFSIFFVLVVFISWGLSLLGVLGTLFREFIIFLPLISMLISIFLFTAFENRAIRGFDTRRKKKIFKVMIIILSGLALVTIGFL